MPTTKSKKSKKEKVPEPHWQELVHTLFAWCAENFHSVFSFDNSQPRDFRQIIVALRKKAEHENKEWTAELAVRMLRVFLTFANQDNFLHHNFLLFHLNRQKDKIFFQIKEYQLTHKNQ